MTQAYIVPRWPLGEVYWVGFCQYVGLFGLRGYDAASTTSVVCGCNLLLAYGHYRWGRLGSLTTLSTFSFDILKMLQSGMDHSNDLRSVECAFGFYSFAG